MPESSIISARIHITGTTGLVLDNIDSADPESRIYKQRKIITDKRTGKTEDDQRTLDELDYLGSFYIGSDGELVLPVRCIRRAVRTGAYNVGGASLSGKIDAGVAESVTEWPILHGGPDDPRELYKDEQYRLRAMVNKNPTGKKAMVPRVRPLLPRWGLTLDLAVFTDVIDWDAAVRTFEATGKTVGLGNARKLGYGRFIVEAEKL